MLAFDNSGPGDFGLLRPSIRRVNVNEAKHTLTIEGLFGLPPYQSRKVTIACRKIRTNDPIVSGSAFVDSELGASAYGDVLVTINGLESNSVPVTLWSADATFSVAGPGDLKASVTVNIRLRGDVHDFREEPGKLPEQFVSKCFQ